MRGRKTSCLTSSITYQKEMSIKIVLLIASLISIRTIHGMDFENLSILDVGVIASTLLMWSMFGYKEWRMKNGRP